VVRQGDGGRRGVTHAEWRPVRRHARKKLRKLLTTRKELVRKKSRKACRGVTCMTHHAIGRSYVNLLLREVRCGKCLETLTKYFIHI
jgi:hypothetical protein